MGKLAVQKYFSFSILILTVLVMIFTLVGLYGGDVQPAGNTARAMLVYALPLLIAADVVLLVFWLIMRRWHWGIGVGADWRFGKRMGAYAELNWGVSPTMKSNFHTIEQKLFPIYGTLGLTYRLR